MILYFLRHAEADARAESDSVRNLTDRGREQAARVGKFLRAKNLRPELILASPVLRALQTARIVADDIGVDLLASPWLACGMEPESLFRELEAHGKRRAVLLVGHEPDFSRAISALLGIAGQDSIRIRKASLTAVLWDEESGSAQLQFSVPVRLM